MVEFYEACNIVIQNHSRRAKVSADNHCCLVGNTVCDIAGSGGGNRNAAEASHRQPFMMALALVGALLMVGWMVSCVGKQATPHRRTVVMPSPQRMDGDPQRGRDYLIYGNYLTSGAPLEMFQSVVPERERNVLDRQGVNATIPFDFTVVNSDHGLPIVVANCLQCHADTLDGQFIMGLGNARVDFTRDYGVVASVTDAAIALRYGRNSPQRKDYQRFRDTMLAVAPYIKTEVRGANPADKLAFLLASHRDPATLQWTDHARIPESLRTSTIPSDVPAWWLLKKKHAMFYNASGRGDFARTMMASSLVTLTDTTEAAAIDRQFVDVYAYLRTIEAPVYPRAIDAALASQGQLIFEKNCASCHGTYGQEPTYPNRVIPLDVIGTDPALAHSTASVYPEYVQAYNDSWFASGPHGSRLEPQLGYIAPPLDGVWATAPYLHNGSVPTLAALLESTTRPNAWRRDNASYDYKNVGLKFTVVETMDESGSTGKPARDTRTYRTHVPGYRNTGHQFGDPLSTTDRLAVIEYLKSL